MGEVLLVVSLSKIQQPCNTPVAKNVLECLRGRPRGNIQTVEMAVVSYGDLAEAQILCHIIIGGVSYDDGTTAKTLFKGNFDALGTHNLLYIKPKSAHSNCHKFIIIQGCVINVN
jgi:hypothetical protein